MGWKGVGLLLIVASGCLGIHPDEVGKKDWVLKNVGQPRSVLVAQPTMAAQKGRISKILIAQTEQNSIAGLSAKTGKVVWRSHSQPDGNTREWTMESVLVNGQLATLSGSTLYVRDGVSGALLHKGTYLKSASGTTHWVGLRATEGEVARVVAMGVSQVAKAEGTVEYLLAEVTLDLEGNTDGAERTRPLLLDGSLDWSLPSVLRRYSKATPYGLLTLDPSKGMVTLTSAVGDGSSSTYSIPEWKSTDNLRFAASQSVGGIYVAEATSREGSRHALFITLTPEGKLQVEIESLGGGETAFAASIGERNLYIKAKALTTGIEGTIRYFGADGKVVEGVGEEKTSFTYQGASLDKNGLVSLVAVRQGVQSGGRKGEGSVQVVIATEDGHLAVVQEGKTLLWAREEARSDIQDVSFFNVPSEDAEARKSREETFGFHRLMIGTTGLPGLVAMSTTDGAVQWSRSIRALLLQEKVPKGMDYVSFSRMVDARVLRQQTLPSSSPGQSARHTFLWTRVSGGDERLDFDSLLVVNALTGEVVAREDKMGGWVSVILSKGTPYGSHPSPNRVLVTDKQKKVVCLGENLQVDRGYDHERRVGRFHFHTVDRSTGKAVGYSVGGDGVATVSWQSRFGSIVTVGSYNTPEALLTASNFRRFPNTTVTGGEVWGLKYLNPSLLVIVSRTQPEAKSLSLFLVDTVTGSTLRQRTLSHATGVTLLLVENTVFVHYLDTKQLRYLLLAENLYEDSPSLRTSTGAAFLTRISGSTRPQQSSMLLAPPLSDPRSFPFPTAVSALSTTTTSRGITAKMLLAATPNGRLVGIDTRVLEAPNTVMVTYNTKTVLSHNHTLAQTRGIFSAPTNLESTSHVVSVGLDIFYTRVAPSEPYDMLSEDYSTETLMAVIGALTVALFAARYFARRKEISRQWA